jgi:hypothetical protein
MKILVANIPESILVLFGNVGPKNPRAIKRMLNLISYRSGLVNSDTNYVSATLWTMLEYIIDNTRLIHLYDQLLQQGNSLGHAIHSYNDNWNQFKRVIYSTPELTETIYVDEPLQKFFTYSHTVSKSLGLSEQDLDNNFNTLYVNTNEVTK